jgi:chromosomal replication initiation ATPase DnaA
MNAVVNYFAVPGLRSKTKAEVIEKEAIIKAVEIHFKTDFATLLERNRKRENAFPRQALCYFLYRYTGLNKCEIAKLIQRDHTTVIWTLSTIQNLIETEESIKNQIEQIRNKIWSF